ncbi:cobalt-precorrin-5B (C(1))-methyltransferase CbiD [Cyanobium sp. Morenito 9A2]|uniref:cobalt-precorrin-5B (C(1))-methyltransferase CbiD n=1 Tax=Cyanobium sp. Morenito 9A2 TaxID=2823718 RepID=UPI0020CCD315|nr:cobalt-precorrin-5B (C(1))-methyltransferase CbiD [Cyanobium sp. Morenito 9A2]MCP9850277.1 cobalt-precorrin-5B (C(1))-methyltransferase [Cyanobium sp. Morenito 9A2]
MSSPGGWTLPVWVAAAARAAVGALRGEPFTAEQPLELLEPAGVRSVPVVAAAPLGPAGALAVARCDPGDGLDLTRGLVIWVLASWREPGSDGLQLEAGEGLGVHAQSRELCLSTYARRLLEVNLLPLVTSDQGLSLRIVFPSGRALAERTSNAAFGVVEGLALIGTQAEVQRSADPDQLQRSLRELEARTRQSDFCGDLVLVIGENGLDLAPRLGLPAPLLLKAGNWVGPLLVAAAQGGVKRLLLFGYHGKLIKLAGGIFHTHHHLADGRAEVLTSLAALEGLQGKALRLLHGAPTVEAALAMLADDDPALADRLRQRMAEAIEQRSAAYLARYGALELLIGAVLFDRRRRISALGPRGAQLWEAFSPLGPPEFAP